jgi:hypothetical protein
MRLVAPRGGGDPNRHHLTKLLLARELEPLAGLLATKKPDTIKKNSSGGVGLRDRCVAGGGPVSLRWS